MSKQKISLDEATFLVLAKLNPKEDTTWMEKIRDAKESGNALTIDLREFTITDNMILHAVLWAAALSDVKIVVQALPSNFTDGVELWTPQDGNHA